MQRRAIVTVLDAHRQDLDAISVISDLKGMGILTAEQCQKLVSLDDKEKRHEALLYVLLAHDRPDAYDKLVECMGLRDASIAADLQGVLHQVKYYVVAKLQIVRHSGLKDCVLHLFHAATLKDLMKSPGALSVISGSQCMSVCHHQECIMLQVITHA